jgi:hypothetical protein
LIGAIRLLFVVYVHKQHCGSSRVAATRAFLAATGKTLGLNLVGLHPIEAFRGEAYSHHMESKRFSQVQGADNTHPKPLTSVTWIVD